jgi:hypothetical protein
MSQIKLSDLPGFGAAYPIAEAPGMFFQKLQFGTRWTNIVDGGNSLGDVVLPSGAYVPAGSWTPGQTNFVFNASDAISTNFVF